MGTQPFVGEIRLMPYSFTPEGFMPCHGQVIDIMQYQVLYAVIGDMYGGNGINNFAVPNLQGRAPVNSSTGPGLSPYPTGAMAGVDTVFLTEDNMPQHTHAMDIGIEATASNSTSLATLETPEPDSLPANVQVRASDGSLITGIKQYVKTLDPNDSVKMRSLNVNGTPQLASTGGQSAIPNRQPYLAMDYFICFDGLFPPRS